MYLYFLYYFLGLREARGLRGLREARELRGLREARELREERGYDRNPSIIDKSDTIIFLLLDSSGHISLVL